MIGYFITVKQFPILLEIHTFHIHVIASTILNFMVKFRQNIRPINCTWHQQRYAAFT